MVVQIYRPNKIRISILHLIFYLNQADLKSIYMYIQIPVSCEVVKIYVFILSFAQNMMWYDALMKDIKEK